jgi:hypothetical protein
MPERRGPGLGRSHLGEASAGGSEDRWDRSAAARGCAHAGADGLELGVPAPKRLARRPSRESAGRSRARRSDGRYVAPHTVFYTLPKGHR